jgi:hypothetical protein
MADTMTVDLELLVFGLRNGALVYQRAYDRSLDQLDPDVSASMLLSRFVTDAGALPPRFLLHSTSWRYSEGAVIITYCAIGRHLDLDDSAPAISLSGARVVHGSAERPAPEDIPETAVAAHALRHIKSLLGGPMGPDYTQALTEEQAAAIAAISSPDGEEAVIR